MRARHELFPLVVPVLLCVAAWAMIVARPAARAHVSPQPRQRVELPRHAQRPPSPEPAEAPEPAAATETPAAASNEAPAVAPPTAVDGPVSSAGGGEGETIVIEGEWGCGLSYDGDWYDRWQWSPEGLAWSRRYFYMRRASEARWRAWREARSRRANNVMMPGAFAAMPDEDVPSLCSVFGAACGGGGSSHAVTTAPAVVAEPEPAVVRREGRRWTLANALVEATIDPDALCALAVRHPARDESLPPLTFATPSSSACEVAETAPPDTDVARGGVALAVTWRGNGWWQQAVVSLRDGGASPEASVTRSTRVGASVRVEATNLTGAPLAWTVGGREHTVAPRGVATFGS
ncbi:MAG: hypothetical protein U0324_36235 [Polyangiales bacterium]